MLCYQYNKQCMDSEKLHKAREVRSLRLLLMGSSLITVSAVLLGGYANWAFIKGAPKINCMKIARWVLRKRTEWWCFLPGLQNKAKQQQKTLLLVNEKLQR